MTTRKNSLRKNRNRYHYSVNQSVKDIANSFQKLSETAQDNLKLYPSNPQFAN